MPILEGEEAEQFVNECWDRVMSRPVTSPPQAGKPDGGDSLERILADLKRSTARLLPGQPPDA